MHSPENILITGGCGFIGSNLIYYLLNQTNFSGRIINFDALTYAGNIHNLHGIAEKYPDRYTFIAADICNQEAVTLVFNDYDIDTVIHLAAESHVDRSIVGPAQFVQTNFVGTFYLLEAAKKYWGRRTDVRFHHVSTDEVYGSLGDSGHFVESTAYDPRSPYSASKAGSDHLVRAYWHTYGLPITLSNCSNNYGPYQFPEKLIPLMISNMLEAKPLPVYGDGGNIRDWLYVDDHCHAIWLILTNAPCGQTYNIGGENEWTNIDLVRYLCRLVAKETRKDPESLLNLISFVTDRLGHDRRYAIDCSKIRQQLGWKQETTFEDGLSLTVKWYLNQTTWLDTIRSGAYRQDQMALSPQF